MRRFIHGVTGRRVVVGLLALLALAACSSGSVDSLFTAPGAAGSSSGGSAGSGPAGHAGAPTVEGGGTGATDVQGGTSSSGAGETGGAAGAEVSSGGASGAAGTIGSGGNSGASGSAGKGGTGGTSGTAGTGGSAGKGGTGGTAGTAGTGGSAGKGGMGGTSGTGGTSGAAGTSGAGGTSGAAGTSGSGGTAGTSGGAGSGGTGPLDCIGKPLPVTAPATVQVSGQANVVANGVLAAASGIGVQARTTVLLASGSSNGTGIYSLSVSTGGVPLNLHLEGHSGGYWDTYFYPDDPIANDLHADLLLVTANDATAAAAYANVALNANRALVLVRVLDCNGMAANNATVSVKQAGISAGDFINLSGLLPAAGTAIVLNVLPGLATTVAGAIGQSALRSNTIVPVGGALNLVILTPN